MTPAHLFAYGTLRSSYENRFAQLLRAHATLVGPALVRGHLYGMAGYPALRRSKANEWVYGDLYQLHRHESLLTRLDAYEGPQYRRVVVRAGRIEAWTYEWCTKLPEWRRIPSGDWLSR